MAAILTLHPDRQAGRPAFPGQPWPERPEPTFAAVRPAPVSAAVYTKRRLVVAALVLGLVLGVASFGRSADAGPTAEAEAAAAVSYVVQPGDTLWAIAVSLTTGDPRPVVDALDDIAGGALLQPGQQLIIPGHLLG